MSAYYGIHRSDDYLAHFGIKGMKWGVRKQRPVTGNGTRSAAYNNAKRKLGLATLGGGIIGGSIYAATHKKEMNAITKSAKPKRSKNWMVTVDTRSRKDREAAGESGSRIKYHPNGLSKSDKRRFESNSKSAYDFEAGLKKASRRGGVLGALTIGGGAAGAGIGTLKYIREHPKEYEAYKRRLKKMSAGERIRTIWRNT